MTINNIDRVDKYILGLFKNSLYNYRRDTIEFTKTKEGSPYVDLLKDRAAKLTKVLNFLKGYEGTYSDINKKLEEVGVEGNRINRKWVYRILTKKNEKNVYDRIKEGKNNA